jgi:predicted RNA binding protein YcfA (HicA-like mRNA interferase family)
MPRGYPPLTPREVIAILRARGFQLDRTEGDHEQYEGIWQGLRRLVTVDRGVREFSVDRIKTMISQSGMSREEFYCSTPRTARKIGRHPRSK